MTQISGLRSPYGVLGGRRGRSLARCWGCQVVVVEIMIAIGSGKCRAYLRICQTAGQGGVATVPQISNEVAADLLNDQLHKRARVEVGERHGFSAAGR